MAGGANVVHERRQIGKVLRRQLPAIGRIEQTPRRRLQIGWKIAAQTEADTPLSAIVEKEFAERSREAACERGLAPRPGADLRQREFDVLAGAEMVGGKVGTRAVVVAGKCTANRHPVAAATFRVEHREFGEHRIVAEVLQAELLLAAELPAQRPLPFIGRQVGGFALAREARFGSASGGSLVVPGGGVSGYLAHGFIGCC